MLMSENLETRENALRVVKKERAAKKKTKRVTNMLDLEVNFNADQWENLINYKEAKLVSKASVQKYGLEARHKYILSKIKCRVLHPAYKTKNQYMFRKW